MYVCVAGIGGGAGDLWDKPVEEERQTVDRGNDGGREQSVNERGREMTQSRENLTLHSTHLRPQGLYCHMNQDRIQSDQQASRQPFPSTNPNPNLRLNRVHTSTDVKTNQNSDKGVGQCDVSKQKYSSTGTKAPPKEEQTPSVQIRAPPPAANMSSLCDERQNELQYYITKVRHTHNHFMILHATLYRTQSHSYFFTCHLLSVCLSAVGMFSR